MRTKFDSKPELFCIHRLLSWISVPITSCDLDRVSQLLKGANWLKMKNCYGHVNLAEEFEILNLANGHCSIQRHLVV